MLVHDVVGTRDGVRRSTVYPSGGSFDRTLNDMGSGNHVFPNAMPIKSRGTLRDLYQLWSRMIVVSLIMDSFGLDKKALYSGVIQCRSFDFNTGELNIQHADIRAILSRRFTFGTNGYSGQTTDNKLVLENYTPSSVMPLIIIAGTNWGYDERYLLPIDLSEASSRGNVNRTYYDYNFTNLDSALTEMSDIGPDVDFLPYWTDQGTMRWRMLTGSASDPHLTSGTRIDWNLTGIDVGIYDIKNVEDGTKMSTVSYAAGTGSEIDMKVAWARVNSELPALERMVAYKQADHGIGVLQQHASSDQALHTNPTIQWSYSMRLRTKPSAVALGALHYIGTWDHGWLPDGWQKNRVISYNIDFATEEVRFQTQPIGGA